MTISVIQAVASGNLTSGAVASQTVSITPTAGNKIVAFATWSGTGVSATVADNQNSGNYSAYFDDLDASNDQEMQVFVMEGPSGTGVSGSATTVTVTPSSSTAGVGLWAFEVGGAATAAYHTSTGQVQATPTTGTDATTSGNLSLSTQPGLIIAVSINTGPTGVNAPSAGTGFTSHGTSWAFTGFSGGNPLARAESKRFTSTSSQAGTFTALGNDGHLTLAIALLEAGAGGGGGGLVIVPNRAMRTLIAM